MKKKQRETRFFWNHWKLGVMFKISTPRRLKSIQNIWNHIFDRRCETVDRKKESGRIKETRLLYKFIMTINWGLCFLYTSFSSEAGACCLFTHDEYHKKKKSNSWIQASYYLPISQHLCCINAQDPLSLFFFPFPPSVGKLIQQIDYLSNFLHYIIFLSLPVSSFAVLRAVPEVQMGHWQARPDLTHLFWTAGFPGLHWSHLRPETNQVGNFKVYLIL